MPVMVRHDGRFFPTKQSGDILSPDLNRRHVRRGNLSISTSARLECFSDMNKTDLKEIKDVVDAAFETDLPSVHEEITDLRSDMDTRFAAVERRMDRLDAKIDHIDEKLGDFENCEGDKRLQLEGRVGHLEKQRS
jgi:hypothetical protein